ncbi:MAG: YciI family protein [Thermoanaerobaculia bacterium]
MRVMVLVKATAESEKEGNPLDAEGAAEMFEAMGKFNDELIAAGVMLAGDGLKPSRCGKRIHFEGAGRSMTDGPFAETKELVAGYWIWQVKSMEEAVEWAKRCPNPMPGPSDLELRPLWEAEDFGPGIAAEVNAQRERLAKGNGSNN